MPAKLASNMGGTANNGNFLESVLPGISGLTSTATGNIAELLGGNPSPALARNANAYWGVGAGQPGTGDINTFIGQRGTDLYGAQAQQNKQQGLSDLLQTLGAYAAPYLSNQGQQLQNKQFGQNLSQSGSQFQDQLNQQASQFGQNLNQNQNQFNQNYALNQFQAMLAALGLGNNITGQLPGNINF